MHVVCASSLVKKKRTKENSKLARQRRYVLLAGRSHRRVAISTATPPCPERRPWRPACPDLYPRRTATRRDWTDRHGLRRRTPNQGRMGMPFFFFFFDKVPVLNIKIQYIDEYTDRYNLNQYRGQQHHQTKYTKALRRKKSYNQHPGAFARRNPPPSAASGHPDRFPRTPDQPELRRLKALKQTAEDPHRG